jgi:hypothetical protein
MSKGAPPPIVNMAMIESMRQAEQGRSSAAHPSSAEGYHPSGGVNFPGVGNNSIDSHHNLGKAAINVGTDGEGINLGVFLPSAGGGFFEQSIFAIMDGSLSPVPGLGHHEIVDLQSGNLGFQNEITHAPKLTALPGPHNNEGQGH